MEKDFCMGVGGDGEGLQGGAEEGGEGMEVDGSVPGDVEGLDEGTEEMAQVGAGGGEGKGCIGLGEGAVGESGGKVGRVDGVEQDFTEDVGGEGEKFYGRSVCRHR